MTPKQEKFLIAKFHELSQTIKFLDHKQSDVETFLLRHGYKPTAPQIAPLRGASVAGAVVAPA